MSAVGMVPVGWISGGELVYRTADAIHATLARAGLEPIEGVAAAQAAEAHIGGALTAPRPLLRAFVRQDGEWFQVPTTHWLTALDAHLAGVVPSPLSLALLSPRLPPAFGPYAGRAALYAEENVEGFVALIGSEPRAAPSPAVRAEDPERPWRQFPNPGAVKKWLMHPVAATKFADRLLADEGILRPTERERRVALDRYLTQHGVRLGATTVGTYRREGRHKVN